MIHLTLTGWGSQRERMLCQTTPADGDTFWHFMYCSDAQLRQPNVCPRCKTVLDDDEAAGTAPYPPGR